MSKKYGLDKFHTKESVVDSILEKIKVDDYNIVIEPSAGNGSFSKKIKNVIAYDIEPESEEIIKQDFLQLDIKPEGKILVIGNPPFGTNGSLALSFIKKSCEFADTIAFILPKSFKKQSFYDKIPLNFSKILEEDIPESSFTYLNKTVDIPCVFQIYKRSINLREKEKIEVPDFFSFVDKESANLCVRRVGVYAGKAFLETNGKSIQSHYFLLSKNPEDLCDLINKINWEHNNTVGPRSISKPELIKEVIKNLI